MKQSGNAVELFKKESAVNNMEYEINDENKIAVMILGMHRSATSLTAMILCNAGGYAGNDKELLAKGTDNPEGFYERIDIVELQEQMCRKNGGTWMGIPQQKLYVDKQDRKKAWNILKKLASNAQYHMLVLKDPRFCLFGNLWHGLLSRIKIKEKVVVVFRHPSEVALSLKKREGMSIEFALSMWYYYNIHILGQVMLLKRNKIPVLYINHEGYFSDKQRQISKLLNFIECKESWENFSHIIKDQLRHHSEKEQKIEDNILYREAIRLYDFFLTLENDQEKLLCEAEIDKYKKIWKDVYEKQYFNALQGKRIIWDESKKNEVYARKRKIPRKILLMYHQLHDSYAQFRREYFS